MTFYQNRTNLYVALKAYDTKSHQSQHHIAPITPLGSMQQLRGNLHLMDSHLSMVVSALALIVMGLLVVQVAMCVRICIKEVQVGICQLILGAKRLRHPVSRIEVEVK